MMAWRRDLTTSIRLLLALAALCGGIYSLAVLGIAQGLFPVQASGSLVTQAGRIVGSRLIGQAFTGPLWFHGRPSATLDATGKPDPYNADGSGGSNLGATNPALIREVRTALDGEPGTAPDRLPPVLVESSASGLDPDITPEAALVQVTRVAAARHIPPGRLRALIHRLTRDRWLGLFGHERVNVFELNLALSQGTLN